jgi:hypothetical protein
MEFAKEPRRRRDDSVRPFVSTVEFEGTNIDGTLPQAPFIVRELVFRIPIV